MARQNISWCVDSGKKCYGTKKQALSAASAASKKYNIELNIYKCPDCNSFHLTKNARERDISGGCKIE